MEVDIAPRSDISLCVCLQAAGQKRREDLEATVSSVSGDEEVRP